MKTDVSNDIAGRRAVPEAREDIARIKATLAEFRASTASKATKTGVSARDFIGIRTRPGAPPGPPIVCPGNRSFPGRLPRCPEIRLDNRNPDKMIVGRKSGRVWENRDGPERLCTSFDA